MGYFLGLLVVIVIALIMANSGGKKEDAVPVAVIPLSERSLEELKQKLQEVETDIEMQKLKYQSYLSNPYVTHIVRDLAKNTLESTMQYKAAIVAAIDKKTTAIEV